MQTPGLISPSPGVWLGATIHTERSVTMYREDMLFVGTQSDLLAYNVEANSDVWFKDAPDGVSTMTFGNVPSLPSPLALVGGNCSIQGFEQAGEELYWTVVGDNVSALAMVDTTGDGNVRRRPLPACVSAAEIGRAHV